MDHLRFWLPSEFEHCRFWRIKSPLTSHWAQNELLSRSQRLALRYSRWLVLHLGTVVHQFFATGGLTRLNEPSHLIRRKCLRFARKWFDYPVFPPSGANSLELPRTQEFHHWWISLALLVSTSFIRKNKTGLCQTGPEHDVFHFNGPVGARQLASTGEKDSHSTFSTSVISVLFFYQRFLLFLQ